MDYAIDQSLLSIYNTEMTVAISYGSDGGNNEEWIHQ